MDERTGAAQGVMLRLPKLTPRMMLILAHDLLAAVAAVVAAFYIRFELAGLTARWHLLLLLLPGFVIYSAGVFSIFGLYKNKWRFTSLPDLMNIIKVSTVLAITLLTSHAPGDLVTLGLAGGSVENAMPRSISTATIPTTTAVLTTPW